MQFITSIVRVGTLIYTLLDFKNHAKYPYYYDANQLDVYLYFEVPFNLVIASSIVSFFQW